MALHEPHTLPDAPPPVARRETLPAPVRSPSPTLDPPERITAESHMLPPHRSKLERITDHVAAVSADLREWTELRIALVKRQVEGVVGIIERVQHLAEAAKLAAPGILLILIGLMFVLVTIALALGEWIGSYAAGFLIVTVLLLGAGGVLVWLGKRRYDQIQAEVAAEKRRQRHAAAASRPDLIDDQRARVQASAA